jgi:hypothetical protein
MHTLSVFDVYIDFTKKARVVARGHVTDPPSSLTYSSIVACDSVWLAFFGCHTERLGHSFDR